MTLNVRELLARPLDEVKRPAPIPVGTYFGTLTNLKYRETPWVNQDTDEKDLQVGYTIRNLEPQDIDTDLLEDIDLDRVRVTAYLPITGGNEYITKLLLESLGVPTSGRTFEITCPEAIGHRVMFDIIHRMNKDDPTAPPFVEVRNVRKKPD